MKKIILTVAVFLNFQSFVFADDLNWDAIRKSDNSFCKKITLLKDSNELDLLKKTHIELKNKCVVGILEEKGF